MSYLLVSRIRDLLRPPTDGAPLLAPADGHHPHHGLLLLVGEEGEDQAAENVLLPGRGDGTEARHDSGDQWVGKHVSPCARWEKEDSSSDVWHFPCPGQEWKLTRQRPRTWGWAISNLTPEITSGSSREERSDITQPRQGMYQFYFQRHYYYPRTSIEHLNRLFAGELSPSPCFHLTLA